MLGASCGCRDGAGAAWPGPSVPPVKPARIFHGWYLVGAALVAGGFASGVGAWAAALFVVPMTQELGWSRAAFYGAMTVRSVVAGVIAPFVGPLQDTKRGPRLLMFTTALCLGVGMIGLKFTESIWWFYLLYGALGAVTFMGGAEMLTTAVLPKWFVRQRSKALAMASAGLSLGPLLFPAVTTGLLAAFGWRDSWAVLGVAALVLLLPLGFLVHTRPEDIGLLPDGAPPVAAAAGGARVVVHQEHSFTLRQVLRLRSFWLLTLSSATFGLAISGFHSNWLVYFHDVGFSGPEAALSATCFGVGSLCSRLVWGTLSARLTVRWLLGIETLLVSATVPVFLAIGSVPMMMVVAFCHGLAVGGNFVLRPLIVADYYGRAHLGAINGVVRPFNTVCTAFGSVIVASLYDLTGAYVAPFAVVTSMWFISGVAALLAPPPRRPAAAPGTPRDASPPVPAAG